MYCWNFVRLEIKSDEETCQNTAYALMKPKISFGWMIKIVRYSCNFDTVMYLSTLCAMLNAIWQKMRSFANKYWEPKSKGCVILWKWWFWQNTEKTRPNFWNKVKFGCNFQKKTFITNTEENCAFFFSKVDIKPSLHHYSTWKKHSFHLLLTLQPSSLKVPTYVEQFEIK